MNPSADSQIRLLIVIPVRLYREGLAMRLEEHARFEIVGTAQSSTEASTLALALAIPPDVAIVDACAAASRQFMQALTQQHPGTRVLAFGVEEKLNTILECTQAGASGYFDANGSLSELIDAIERIVSGELACSPNIVAELLRRIAQPASLTEPAGLTRRQQQVLALLERGLANKQIAATLNIAEATVKNHVHQVLEKLRVPSRAQAAAFSRMV